MRLLTPPGHGGVAVVVAESTAERRELLACLSTPAGAALATKPGQAPVLGELLWDGVPRDEVLVVDRGGRGLELHLHGSPAVVAALAARFGPLRRDAPGPADRLLRSALSEAQLALALEQRAHDFAAFLGATSAMPAVARQAALAAARERSRVALALCQPLRVVLAGRQNAGKSTLLNRLVFRERAATGPEPGLTRDPVREVTCLSGYPYELVDTAGEGPCASAVDARALGRARAERDGGELLLVVDGSRGPDAVDRALWSPRAVVVALKADLPQSPWPQDLPCDLRLSCVDPACAPAVRGSVGELLRRRRRLPPAGPVGGPAALDEAQSAALLAASAGGARPA